MLLTKSYSFAIPRLPLAESTNSNECHKETLVSKSSSSLTDPESTVKELEADCSTHLRKVLLRFFYPLNFSLIIK